ncbi:hypothetical protein ABH899_000800 [Paenibacillus sp. RC84]
MTKATQDRRVQKSVRIVLSILLLGSKSAHFPEKRLRYT